MNDDSIVSLACSMYAKKGVYSLLLGSGISRAAGIPTGWEITCRLIEKIAGEELSDPAGWYLDKVGKEPDYSEIIKKVGGTQAERSLLLREFFEPVQDSEDPNLKRPTKAHKSIARLIKSGFIKVVLTTNFDRLLEQALFEEGIVSEVISNIDQIIGATPLSLVDCIIVKVHGDYKDARILNTESELAVYKPALRKYLDRIFDEFGLIICGWSGDWDIALRGCLERCKSLRFTTYWLHVGEPSEKAEGIIKHRWAEKIKIENANEFFSALEEKLTSLNDLSLRNQNLNIDIACANLKRWIPDKNNYIKIRELILNEARFAISVSEKQPVRKTQLDPFDFKILEEAMKKLSRLIIILCYYSKDNCAELIIDALDILTKQISDDVFHKWDYYYPASIFIFSVLLSCIRSESYSLLYKVLNHKFKKRNNVYDIEPEKPISTHLYLNHAKSYSSFYELLKPHMDEFVADKLHYDQLFDKAQCFFAMFFRDINNHIEQPAIKMYSIYGDFNDLFFEELSEGTDSQKILLSGFFGGSIIKFKEHLEKIKRRNPF